MIRYKEQYKIPEYDISIITEDKHLTDLFEGTVEICNNPKKVSNWIMGETLRLMKENELDAKDILYSPENLAKLVELTEKNVINSSVAKEVFEVMFRENCTP